MELKEGMFIRFQNYISKIEYVKTTKIGNTYIQVREPNRMLATINAKYITKASNNIIDLIEVGDLVNNQIVYQVGYNYCDDYVVKVKEYDDYTSFIYPNEIKTIITKEQLESMQYRVEE